MTPRSRVIAFLIVTALVVGSAAAYLVIAGRTVPASEAEIAPADLTQPFIAFKRTSIDSAFRSVGIVPYDDPAAPPSSTGLICERIDVSRFGGICLTATNDLAPTAEVRLLEGDLTVRFTLSTAGIPSRARVSADGRWAATTTFVYGHSYADANFSTATEIYDMAAGSSLGNLEDWRISRNGQPFEEVDTNIWGVTFAPDSDTFYATLRSGDQINLVEGRIAARTIEVLEVVAECPSLSPSGELLAYKSATGPGIWQVRVRSMADGSEIVIDDSRSVDDQIAWLDDQRVAYGVYRDNGGAVTDVWEAPADGSAPASLFIQQAWSPTVVR